MSDFTDRCHDAVRYSPLYRWPVLAANVAIGTAYAVAIRVLFPRKKTR